jgi:FkbM family methyltransferase
MLKQALKRLRSSQPFNMLATGALRRAFQIVGAEPEVVIKHLHHVGPTRVKLPNGRTLRLWSRGDDWVSNQIFWRGWDGYEPETGPLFFHMAQRANVTLDIGAYVGFFSLLAAHANPRGQVYSFEPMPQIFGRLKANVARNYLKNVECFLSAVGAERGTADFYYSTDTLLPTSSSLSQEFMQETPNLTHTSVPVATIDDFVRERGIARVDLIKIDTESTEPDVLRGMSKTLERDHPDMVCEVLHGRGTAEALEEILRPLGYRFYHLSAEGPQLRDHIEPHPELFNYLFSTSDDATVAKL